MIKLPVNLGYGGLRVGTLEIDESSLPPTPDYLFAIGYSLLETDSEGRHMKHQLLEIAIVPDSKYRPLVDGKIPEEKK